MRTILLIILFLNISCKKSFDFKVVHNSSKRESIIYLFENDIKKIDSIIINDYYGKNNINKTDDNLWNIEYSTRCGSGCITRNIILINQVNKKINIPLHISKEYKDSIYSKTVNIEKKVNGDLFINLQTESNKKVYNNEQKLNYNSEANIYFNHEFKYDNNYYKGIKLDSFEFIFFNKKWAEFSSKINKIYYDF